ncbi:tetratricopeptide repeat protein [Variovorax sp. GT1P44]|uniref:tetratricopeptide repeat protein n=1 Tax=Variovorax sp. GT1P44 TaxID=3443742 RepID=UPI003F4910CA
MLGLPAAYCGAQEAASRSAAAITDMRVNDPGLMGARSALLARAEAELALGKVAAATETFERAAMMLHAPDTEMGLVRAYMQAGEYRRALAFCAHVAGAHLESGPAGALYAWLLRAGGQGEVAARVLQETLDRLPQDPVALDARRAFASQSPVARGLMLRTPHRMAPQGVGKEGQPVVPEAARVVSSGVLIGDGTTALVPSAAIRPDTTRAIWVRNGMGDTTLARADPATQPLASLGVTVLRLAAPLTTSGTDTRAARDPFAGSAGFALAYAANETAEPAWPWLSQGFFGTLQGREGGRKLGIGLAADTDGGPVFDASGRLAGMVLRGLGDEAAMLPASRWADLLPGAPTTRPDEGASPRPGPAIPADQAYEYGLRTALQVIVLR